MTFTTTLDEITDANLTATVEVDYIRNGGCNGDWYTPTENPFAEGVVATGVEEARDEEGNTVALTQPLKSAILTYVNERLSDILGSRAARHLLDNEE